MEQSILNYDILSTNALVSLYLNEKNDEISWRILGLLHSRGSKSVLRVAIDLCNSDDSVRRELGADILAQLGGGDCRFARESEKVLLHLLRDESVGVLSAAIHAVGLLRFSSSIKSLVEQSKHESAEIREAVAYALGLVGAGSILATEALIALIKDIDVEVRDWAVFSLAVQLEDDSETVVTALSKCLTDTDSIIRGEALLGLIRRGHKEMAEKVRNEIETGNLNDYILEAAEHLAHPSLCKTLVAAVTMVVDPDTMALLAKAIAACCDKPLGVRSALDCAKRNP